MRFKKAAVMVLAASLVMTPFTANSSYVSANETTKVEIQGLIFKDMSEDDTTDNKTTVDNSSVNVSSQTIQKIIPTQKVHLYQLQTHLTKRKRTKLLKKKKRRWRRV